MPKSARNQVFPYRSSGRYPCFYKDGSGQLVQDAVSGAWYAMEFQVDSVNGLVDGRNGNTVDLSTEEHELSPDNVQRPPY